MKTLSMTGRNWVDVPASHEAVFGFLADIERLPQWAPEIFERVELGHDGWRALTCFGELFVDLTSEARSGFVYLQAGFERQEAGIFSFWLTERSPKVTRVRLAAFSANTSIDDRHDRIYRALVDALGGLFVVAAEESREPISIAV